MARSLKHKGILKMVETESWKVIVRNLRAAVRGAIREPKIELGFLAKLRLERALERSEKMFDEYGDIYYPSGKQTSRGSLGVPLKEKYPVLLSKTGEINWSKILRCYVEIPPIECVTFEQLADKSLKDFFSAKQFGTKSRSNLEKYLEELT